MDYYHIEYYQMENNHMESYQMENYQEFTLNHVKIIIIVGKDICQFNVDAIVNAANASLHPGAGVCGAIYNSGGPSIFKECAEYLKSHGITSLEEGDAMITSGGNLKAKHVIHAVGPIWKNSTPEEAENDKQKLYNAYFNSLKIAEEHHLKSIAFPSISTGIFGFPLNLAAPIAAKACKDFINETQNSSIQQIYFVVWPNNFKAYNDALTTSIR